MAKLYWKVKRDGKWQWSPVNSDTTQGDFEQIEYIGGDCESGVTRMRVTKSAKPKSNKKTKCDSMEKLLQRKIL